MSLVIPLFFFFNDTATTEIYTLSLHDALPISFCSPTRCWSSTTWRRRSGSWPTRMSGIGTTKGRSEEHTSELQSRLHLVCRLLLEKKKTTNTNHQTRPSTPISLHSVAASLTTV